MIRRSGRARKESHDPGPITWMEGIRIEKNGVRFRLVNKPLHVRRLARSWLSQFVGPLRVRKGLRELPHFFQCVYQYSKLPGAEPIRVLEILPQLHDRTQFTPFNKHYFYMGAWATRRIVGRNPKIHVDIGSSVVFVSTLTAMTTVVFVDYRPLRAKIRGLIGVAGDILSLPFADDSLKSLSCLHVAEHIGLGRYDDRLDAQGTEKAIKELARVVAPGGDLFFALPIGRERLCFNGHRVHAPATVVERLSSFNLVEFSGVHDDGTFVECARLGDFIDDEYACGMYWLQKSKLVGADGWVMRGE
jgi:SAM-dependent methyltransferase